MAENQPQPPSPQTTPPIQPPATFNIPPSASEASQSRSAAEAQTVAPQPQTQPVQPAVAATIIQSSPEPSTKSPFLKYGIIAAIAAIILGGGGFAAYKFFFSKDAPEEAESSSTSDNPPSINFTIPDESAPTESTETTGSAEGEGSYEELQDIVSELKETFTEEPAIEDQVTTDLDFSIETETEFSTETETDSNETVTSPDEENPKRGVER